jgi:serine/threonine-protein kinase
MSTSPSSLAPELLAFQAAVAGRYSITHELGRGGMGIVFLAREVALDRMVALKLLPPDMAARPGVKERFLQEARTAARLSHPHIVQIYAVDEADDFVFFAMAFVDGGTLGDRIRERGPLSNSEAVRLLREVSWALGHAHLQGVIHRDVKPDNILLDQESGRAMVTDFGIAVVAEDAETESATQVVGTAEFMSPEQATGRAVDARSDLYSLACVGFYALSGRFLFTGATAAEVLIAHVNEPAPSVLSAAPHVPPAVASALDRCIRKDPEQRFAGGEALADALQPQGDTGRELAVPLRVFIKDTRDWETTVSVSLAVFFVAFPSVLVAMAVDDVPGVLLVAAAVLVASLGVPFLSLVRQTRRLLKSGFTQADATVAFLKDIDRKEEEFRFKVGERVTMTDRALRAIKLGGFGIGAAILAPAIFGTTGDALAMIGIATFDIGIFAALIQEVRARARGDVMGERYLRFWKSKAGKKLFDIAGMNLKRVAPSIAAGAHRPTEAVIGLEADRLFEELPKDVQKSLEGLPDTVQALEADAQGMRKQVAEMEAILAEIGDDDPSAPSAAERARVRAGVEATRDEAKEKLREAVAALETIRLGLLYMQAGTGTVESLTMELKAAKGISDDMDNLLAGHREVERILQERRETGVFTLVTDPGSQL